MDNLFIITIILVFLSVLVGTYIRSRSRDKCLKDFDNFHITMEETDGDVIWGRLKVYSSGLKLIFDDPYINLKKNTIISYILYDSQFSTIFAFYRFHDELSKKNREVRRKIIKRAYSTAFFQRIFRKTRGIINTFRDAIIKSVGIILGQLQSTGRGGAILKSQQTQITTISSDIVGYVGNAYDPILEQMIGETVVIDIFKGGKKNSVCGMLMEYSEKFIEICDIKNELVYSIPLLEKPIKLVSKHFKVCQDEKNNFSASNEGDVPFQLHSITGKGIDEEGKEITVNIPLNKVLDTGDKADFITPDLKYSEINMKISIVREYDLIIPRSHSVIRHECKKILNNKDQSAKTDMDSKQTESIQDTKDVKDVENNKENIK